jgi:release factor glutamine methyltransferase
VSRIDALLARRAGEARRDLEVLLGHVLRRPRAWLYAHGDTELDDVAERELEALLARRDAGEPVAYLVGEREFYGLDFAVGPAVLVPRPETELLVEIAAAHTPPGGRVLDVGTGSGAIVIALATTRPDATFVAVDVDPAALAVARCNAARHRVLVAFTESDVFADLEATGFDVIVSNPPYVRAGDPQLATLRHEPRHALVGGVDGLAVIDRLVAGAPDRLRREGLLVVEHGADQGPAVRALFARAGLRDVETVADLAGLPRATLGRR